MTWASSADRPGPPACLPPGPPPGLLRRPPSPGAAYLLVPYTVPPLGCCCAQAKSAAGGADSDSKAATSGDDVVTSSGKGASDDYRFQNLQEVATKDKTLNSSTPNSTFVDTHNNFSGSDAEWQQQQQRSAAHGSIIPISTGYAASHTAVAAALSAGARQQAVQLELQENHRNRRRNPAALLDRDPAEELRDAIKDAQEEVEDAVDILEQIGAFL